MLAYRDRYAGTIPGTVLCNKHASQSDDGVRQATRVACETETWDRGTLFHLENAGDLACIICGAVGSNEEWSKP